MISTPARDIRLNDSHECVIENGDFVATDSRIMNVGGASFWYNECDERCIYDTLASTPGGWRNTPTMWVNLINDVNAPLSPNNRLMMQVKMKAAIETEEYFSVAAISIHATGEVSVEKLIRKKQ